MGEVKGTAFPEYDILQSLEFQSLQNLFSVSKCSGPDFLSWSIHSNIWTVFACFKWICKHLLQTPETAKLPSSTFLLKCTSSNSLKVSTSLRHRPRAKAPKNIPNQSALKMQDARRESGEMWGSCSACGTPESLLASIKSCRARRRSWPSLRLCHWTQWYMAATNYWTPQNGYTFAQSDHPWSGAVSIALCQQPTKHNQFVVSTRLKDINIVKLDRHPRYG